MCIRDRYYTNSFHIPVYYPISAYNKIKLEGPYHALTNGGHISYICLLYTSKHILYVKNLVGIDYVGLGSDFDGISQNLEIKDASMMPMLKDALFDAGLTEEEIEKVFYKNVLRVYQEILMKK